MPASATARCSRCGHEPTYQAKLYAPWRVAMRHAPASHVLLLIVCNLLIAVFVPRRPICSWCHARRTPKAQASYSYDSFVHQVRHSRDEMALRRRAARLRPHPSTGRWKSEDRREVLDYLAWRDKSRCGLCAMPVPTGEAQIEHVVPKKFGMFDVSGGRASAGRTLRSMLDHVNNLQLAHDYCNRAKGNTPYISRWRHPRFPSLPVAGQVGAPRRYFWLPAGNRDRGSPGSDIAAGPRASAPSIGTRTRARAGPKAAREGRRREYTGVSFRSRRGPQSSRASGLIGAVGMVAAGLVLLFVLIPILGRDADEARPSGAAAPTTQALPSSPAPRDKAPPPPAPAATPSPAPAQTPAPPSVGEPVEDPGSNIDPMPSSDLTVPTDGPAVTTSTSGPTTSSAEPAGPPAVELTAPPDDWVPAVDANTSTFGHPDRSEFQWAAWQPGCPSCEPGATLSWVGSYAHPFNGNVFGTAGRPKLESACLHRVRSGPLIDWGRDVSDDAVEAIWVDGESAPPGSWWLHEQNNRVMIPEPAPFVESLQDAQQLRVLTAGGHDATFDVAGFLTSVVQANLDHCGYYP